jgi:hypothetical protein
MTEAQRKTKLEKKLARLGYEGDQVDYERLLFSNFKKMFPTLTIDKLAARPTKALKFVARIQEYLPKAAEEDIMEPLLNIRKAGKASLYS